MSFITMPHVQTGKEVKAGMSAESRGGLTMLARRRINPVTEKTVSRLRERSDAEKVSDAEEG